MTTILAHIKTNITSIIKQMNQHPHDYVKNPGKDFSRNRKLSFKIVINIILSMEGNNLSK